MNATNTTLNNAGLNMTLTNNALNNTNLPTNLTPFTPHGNLLQNSTSPGVSILDSLNTVQNPTTTNLNVNTQNTLSSTTTTNLNSNATTTSFSNNITPPA